ncbi:MAG: hypothetical protein UHI81_04685 [Olegusella sp.]|nr:hypothetical protein [Olegusella sp.]
MDTPYTVEGVSVGMAAMDLVPVVLYGTGCHMVGKRLRNPLFTAGAVVSTASGAGKAAWKMIQATTGKNVFWLADQMHRVMPAGFAAMAAAPLVGSNRDAANALLRASASQPALGFFATGAAGMGLMGYWARALDPTKSRSNWIEQTTNVAAQAAFFAGVVSAVLASERAGAAE